MAQWVGDRGGSYLDGVVLSYPRAIGRPEMMLVYSGPSELWSTYADTLMRLGGRSHHASEGVGTANVLLAAIVAFYVTSLGAYVEALSYLQRMDVAPTVAGAITDTLVEMLGDRTHEIAAAVEAGDFSSDQAVLATYTDAVRTTARSMRQGGQQARLVGAALEVLQDAEAAGLGQLSIHAQCLVNGVRGAAS